MIRRAVPTGGAASGLRTRYFPKSRLGQGLISMGPWLNLVLLIVFLLLLDSRTAIQPGIVIDLPRAPFGGGARPDLVAVIFAIDSGHPGKRDEIIFFDDMRFPVRDEAEMTKLRHHLVQEFMGRPGSCLTVQADADVRYGTVMQLCNMAREIGVPQVNMATREAAKGSRK
jgi:biopolymer transport protein ExbD